MARVTRQEFMTKPITPEMFGKDILVKEPDLIQTKLYIHVQTFWVFRRQAMGVWRDRATNKPATKLQRGLKELW